MTEKTKLKKDWKFYVGIIFLLLSLILPLFSFIVALFELPPKIYIPIIGVLTIGGPEVMVIIGAAFLGKNVYNYYREKFFAIFKRKPKPISKTRYYIGLTIMLFSITPLYINGYLPDIMPSKIYVKNLILLSADLLFVISFFILGGDFWEKFKKLFIWEDTKK
jgi:hypothetical protein